MQQDRSRGGGEGVVGQSHSQKQISAPVSGGPQTPPSSPPQAGAYPPNPLGTSVYQPRLPHPPPAGKVDIIYCPQLDEDSQSVVGEPNDSALGCDTTEPSAVGSFVDPEEGHDRMVVKRQNFVSGRIGEELAVKYLRNFLRGDPHCHEPACVPVRICRLPTKNKRKSNLLAK